MDDSFENLVWELVPELAAKSPALLNELHKLHTVQTTKKSSTSVVDTFLQAVQGFSPDSSAWATKEDARLLEMRLAVAVGKLHPRVIAMCPGYEIMANGDIVNLNLNTIIVCKNRHNTQSGPIGKITVARLHEKATSGYRAIFAQITCPGGVVNRYNAEDDVEVVCGREIYEIVYGRADFLDSLNRLVVSVFAHHHNYF